MSVVNAPVQKIIESGKAIAALLGSVLTAVLAVQAPGSALFSVLTVLGVIATAVATYQTPFTGPPAAVYVPVAPDPSPVVEISDLDLPDPTVDRNGDPLPPASPVDPDTLPNL